MNKVLHIVHSDLGGASSIVFSLVKKNVLWENSILFTGPKLLPEYADKIRDQKIFLNYIKVRKYLSFFYVFKVLYKICIIKPDIIILHNYQLLPVIIYKIFFNKYIIYVDHKPFSSKNFRDYIIIYFMIFFSKYIVTINYKNFFLIKSIPNFFKSKILLIQNGVNINKFSPKYKKFKRKKYFLFGMASRLNKEKLHELIIEAMNNKNLKSNIICYLAGDGEYKDTLKEMVRKQKLEHKIIFLGTLNEKNYKRWLNKIDLYVQCTKGEGMSISLLESLSSGVPVLGSNVTGNDEILEKKKFVGKLFDNNVDSLVKNLNYFKSLNQRLVKLYKINGRNYIKKYHNEKNMINRYDNIIKNLLQIY
jgi:glycosyltransferase involved in cell wall biosynthesis